MWVTAEGDQKADNSPGPQGTDGRAQPLRLQMLGTDPAPGAPSHLGTAGGPAGPAHGLSFSREREPAARAPQPGDPRSEMGWPRSRGHRPVQGWKSIPGRGNSVAEARREHVTLFKVAVWLEEGGAREQSRARSWVDTGQVGPPEAARDVRDLAPICKGPSPLWGARSVEGQEGRTGGGTSRIHGGERGGSSFPKGGGWERDAGGPSAAWSTGHLCPRLSR